MDINIMGYLSANEARQRTNKVLETKAITMDQCMVAIEDGIKEGNRSVTVTGYCPGSIKEKLLILGYSITKYEGDNKTIKISW